MTEKFDTVVPKITPLLRMLTSNVEGEILNAVRALRRCLASNGLDIHALVDRVEIGGEAPLHASEMQQIYDQGFEQGFAKGAEHGRRSAILAAQPIGTFAADVDNDINGYSWQQISQHCLINRHLFQGRDLEFVEGIAEQLTRFSTPRPKQAKWLCDLFMRSFGGKIA
jgi:hypothetical protein